MKMGTVDKIKVSLLKSQVGILRKIKFSIDGVFYSVVRFSNDTMFNKGDLISFETKRPSGHTVNHKSLEVLLTNTEEKKGIFHLLESSEQELKDELMLRYLDHWHRTALKNKLEDILQKE